MGGITTRYFLTLLGKKWNTTSSAVAAAAVWNACGNNSDASGLDLMCPDGSVHTSIFFVVSLSILLLAGISLSALFDEERILDKSLLCSGLGEDRGWLLAPNHAHTTFNERLSHEIEDAFVSARCYALSRGCSCERCGCISGLVLTSPYCLHIPLPLHASSPTVLRVPVLKCSGYCLGRDRLPLLLPTMSGAQVSPLLEREVQGN